MTARRPFYPVPRAVLFDLDDTLCDYASARNLRLRLAFSLHLNHIGEERAGIDLDQMIADSIAMHPHGVDHFRELFVRHGIDDQQVIYSAKTWYRENRFHGLELFPTAVSVLKRVRSGERNGERLSNRPVGIITNGPTEVQTEKIALLGIRAHVDFILISEAFGSAKPEPGIFEAALREAGVDAMDAVFVGDSAEHDIAGAISVGMRTIWVNRAGTIWPGPGPAPERVVRSIREAPELVGSRPVRNDATSCQ